MRALIRRIILTQDGATAVEYGLILSLIVLALIGALSEIGVSTSRLWDSVTNEVTDD